MEDKKYYWIKLKTDFFNQDAIDFIMSQKNGCEYIVLYQMLCLKTANSNGQLTSKIGEMIVPYDVDRIVRDTKYFDVDTVTVAMELFKHLGLIYEQNDNTLAITGFEDMIGKEPDRTNAERQKRFRERQKQKRLETSENNVISNVTDNVTKRNESNVEIEIRDRNKSIEKDIDIEKDIKEKEIPKGISKKKPTKEKYGEYNNVLLTDDEYNRLCEDYTQETTHKAIKFLDEYIEEKGYKSKSHNLAMRRWVFEAIGCVKGGKKTNNSQTLVQKNNDILNNAIATGELK